MKIWLAMAMMAAAVAVQAANNNDTASARANLDLGIAYLQKGNLSSAKDKLERAKQQDPKSTAVRSAVALLYARLGEIDRADTEFRDAVRMAPKDPELMNNYAVFLCGHGRGAEGVALFQQAAASPTYRTPWAALTNAGVCLRNDKHYPEAEAQFKRALEIKPGHAEAVFQLTELQYSQNRTAEAYERIAKYVAANIPTPELLYLGWRTAMDLKDKVNALKLARRLQVEFPNSDQAKTLLAGGNGGKSG
jgi:type IV pilus assembly protein PilF